MRKSFPTVEELYADAVLYTVAMAAYVAPLKDADLLEGWDGETYLLDNGSGDSAAITFRDGAAVGGFFDHESSRSPYRGGGEANDWRRYFEGAPKALTALAEKEALQFLLQDVGDDGHSEPVITTAFWSRNGKMESTDSWKHFLDHSAKLVVVDLDPLELPSERLDWVHAVAERRSTHDGDTMKLTKEEKKTLFEAGKGGAREARQLLEAVGILAR